MLDWLDGRNGSAFQSIAWSGNVLSFNIAVGAGANGLAGDGAGGATAPVVAITFNGSPVAFTLATIKGVSYAVFPAGRALPGLATAATSCRR